jgi:hypothetical protein
VSLVMITILTIDTVQPASNFVVFHAIVFYETMVCDFPELIYR